MKRKKVAKGFTKKAQQSAGRREHELNHIAHAQGGLHPGMHGQGWHGTEQMASQLTGMAMGGEAGFARGHVGAGWSSVDDAEPGKEPALRLGMLMNRDRSSGSHMCVTAAQHLY